MKEISDHEKWIEHYTTGLYEGYNPDIVRFIAEILFKPGTNPESTTNLFESGYCYHFAVILKDIFKDGEIMLAFPLGHIVYMDSAGFAYDISGPYEPSLHDIEYFIPVSFLGSAALVDFTHSTKSGFTITDFHMPKDFHEWAKDNMMTDMYAMTKIFIMMPKDGINYYKDTMPQVVYSYWKNSKEKIEDEYFESLEEDEYIDINDIGIVIPTLDNKN